MRSSLLVFLVACVSLPHVPPQSRTPDQVRSTSVEITSYCGNKVPKSGHGVVISERHILTAYHLVECATIPLVRVTFPNGDTTRTYVTREDPKADIAKLELASADRFGLNIAPPKLFPETGDPTSEVACAKAHRFMCGVVSSDASIINLMDAIPGDSGAGVYTAGISYGEEPYIDMQNGNCGLLLGIVIAKGDGYTRIAPVDNTWLEGT